MTSVADSNGNFNYRHTFEYNNVAVLDNLDQVLDISDVRPPTEMEKPKGAPSYARSTTGWSDNGEHFPRLTLAQMMAMPPKEWLIDQIIGRGDLAMVYGKPGSGKTFVVIDLIISACLGKPFAGRFIVARPLTVAYAAGEGHSGLAQRFRAAVEYHQVNDGRLTNLHIYPVVPQLYEEGDPRNATQFVEEYAAAQTAGRVAPLDLLILDTLHSVTSGADENSSQHMGKVLHQAKLIAERLGCAVILVHHTNKAGTGERGSSALRGAMDSMIEIKEEGDGHTMSCQKLKDGEQWQLQAFGLAVKAASAYVEWGATSKGKADGRKSQTAREILKALADAGDEKLTAKQIGDLISKTAPTVNDVMKRLVKAEYVREGENEKKARCYSISVAGEAALLDEDTPI